MSDEHKANLADGESAPATSEETDAERQARYLQAIDKVTALNRAAALADAPAKFTLGELMLVITLLGVVFGLIRGLVIWGGLITFVAAVVWGNLLYPWWFQEKRRQVAMFDCVWGLLMPMVCVVCDPFVFQEHNLGIDLSQPFQFGFTFRSETLAAYNLMLWQMLFLLAWLVGRPWLRGFAGFFLGTWVVGITITAAMGLLLIVPATIGLVVGIGLMGYTPLFTTFVFQRRIREMLDYTEESVLPFWLLVVLGLLAAIFVPLQGAALLQPFFNPPVASLF